MRLDDEQKKGLIRLARQVIGEDCRVRVFGSRLDDNARGGDLDLLVECQDAVENPALLAAELSTKVPRIFHGRKVDVLISAPNLMHLPIHEVALKEGKLL